MRLPARPLRIHGAPGASRFRVAKARPSGARLFLRWILIVGVAVAVFWAGRYSTVVFPGADIAPFARSSQPIDPTARRDRASARTGTDSASLSTVHEDSALLDEQSGDPTTAGNLCPCPAPRTPPRIHRRSAAPEDTSPPPPRDPTKATALALQKSARDLSRCAPLTGPGVRVHLQVTVDPKGNVTDVRMNNVDPVPQGVSTCVQEFLRGLTLPPFDATVPEVFGLTILL